MQMVGNRISAKVLRASVVLLSILILSAGHFLAPRGTHGLHEIHILLGGMYLLPIIASALWFGLRGSLAAAILISLIYYVYVRLLWPNQPMENANQYAMIAVYWVVGLVGGVLVDLEEEQKERRLKAEREIIIESIAGLSNALQYRDEYTRRHSERVSRLAVRIGTRLGMSPERLDIIRLAGLVHDVGKIGIRDDVLLKTHELSEEEWMAIRQHPIIAAEILKPIYGASQIASIVLAHHECPDGSGYPRGLRGADIPIETGIVRVADVFSTLVDERTYKTARTVEQAIAVLDGLAGTKVDESAFRALKSLVDEHASVM
jgi:putative nucleotidyltransferase with HDIG domain